MKIVQLNIGNFKNKKENKTYKDYENITNLAEVSWMLINSDQLEQLHCTMNSINKVTKNKGSR